MRTKVTMWKITCDFCGSVEHRPGEHGLRINAEGTDLDPCPECLTKISTGKVKVTVEDGLILLDGQDIHYTKAMATVHGIRP